MLEEFIRGHFGSMPYYYSSWMESIVKTWSNLRRGEYKKVMVSISGGSDSDILLDLIERCKAPDFTIDYVFFNTGLEYDATLRHLDYLEQKYNIVINRIRPNSPVPISCKRYGLPFRNKRIANYISRLQAHHFEFVDKPFEVLYKEYPNCKAALRWWCNKFGGRFDIAYTKGLKEYMIENPPQFLISDRCCIDSKKNVAHSYIKENGIDLNIYGVRKSEGGVRSTSYKGCFSFKDGCDEFRPLFYIDYDSKYMYETTYGIRHSDCYCKYGLYRTGCAGCPFGRSYKKELDIIQNYEPKLFKACWSIFGDSYIYDKNFELFRS